MSNEEEKPSTAVWVSKARAGKGSIGPSAEESKDSREEQIVIDQDAEDEEPDDA